ncbi:MAG TPA: sigma 54-interacting transcriptional regulator [Vicinamibacteria bacterium]|nr:sigma 54-interacting transcriptional regulator [Vicinamibacteria bacterium]
MSLFESAERAVAEAAAALGSRNPFLPEWIEAERRVLGEAWIPREAPWHLDPESARDGVPAANRNLALLQERAEALAARARDRLAEGRSPGDAERALYDNLAVSVLYYRYQDRIHERHVMPRDGGAAPVAFFAQFAREARELHLRERPEHLMALVFQFRRAFHYIFRHILGGSEAAGRVRAAIWQSIFTHDMARYRRLLHDRMHDIATLITGPSGTGKELAARAIGLSRYVPFNPATGRFTEDFRATYQTLNLSALSPTLIESELFGHRKGAFTGAFADRVGYLDGKSSLYTILLDEIGEVDVAIQVKLLRVLESRTFQRLGDSAPREFHGKVIAATNRDLAEEIRAGRFRTDLYYRLCSDLVRLPPLAEQLRGDPQELGDLVSLLAGRLLAEGDPEAVPDADAAALTAEVMGCIERDLGLDYAWPGNIRELEQCVRNVLVRRTYRPAGPAPRASSARDQLARDVLEGALSAEELLDGYTTLVYAQAGSYEQAARRLGLDRRTVKRRVDRKLLAALRGPGSGTDDHAIERGSTT